MVVLGRALEARNEAHASVLARQDGPLIRAQEGKASAVQARDFLVPVDCLPSTVALHLQKNLRSLPRATVLQMTPGEPSAGLGSEGGGGLGLRGERAQMQFHNQTPAYLPL